MKYSIGTKEKWAFSPKDGLAFSPKDGLAISSTINSDNEEKANALLISKAPEMLEMLEKISQFIDENEDVNYMVRLLSREIPNIKNLIKEATEL